MTNGAFPEILPGYVLSEGGGEQVREAHGAEFTVRKTADGYAIDLPEFPGHAARSFACPDWLTLDRVNAEAWLRHMAVAVDLGFHPDTPLEGYEPPLPGDLARDYDAAMDRAFGFLDDPYAVALDAWRRGGVIERTRDEEGAEAYAGFEPDEAGPRNGMG